VCGFFFLLLGKNDEEETMIPLFNEHAAEATVESEKGNFYDYPLQITDVVNGLKTMVHCVC